MTIFNREDSRTVLPQLEKSLEKSLKGVNQRIDGLLDFFYPVGCYFETSDIGFDPNEAWGGEWELELEGMFHLSAGTHYAVNHALTNDTKDGGESSVYLSVDTLPSHNHTQNGHAHYSGLYTAVDRYGGGGTLDAAGAFSGYGNPIYTDTQTPYINPTGNSKAHNNMPPYIIVNRWHRIK